MGACSYVLIFFIECHKAVRLVSCFHHAYWWRQPVETQDFASHEEVSAMCSCYNQRVVIAFVACETQDFASLLISVSVIKGWIMMCYYNGVCQ